MYDDTTSATYNTTQYFGTSNEGLQTSQLLVACFAAFGIPGNIGAIIVLLSNSQIRQKAVNIFMIHQSVIDLCGCIVTILTALITDASSVNHGMIYIMI